MAGLTATIGNPNAYNESLAMTQRGYQWDQRRGTWVNPKTGKTYAEEKASTVTGNTAYDQEIRMKELDQAGSMKALEAQIAAQAGMATTAQAAEMARLQAQLGTDRSIATESQTGQTARLGQQIAGTSALTSLQSKLGNETEEMRYTRAKEQQAVLAQQMKDTMTQFGIGGQPAPATGAGGAAPTGATTAQEDAADAAAFAAAKDKIGLVNRAAQTDIGNEVIARGIGGSGIEAGMRAGAIESGQGQLGQVVRDEATAKRGRAYQVADRDVAAGLTKRAQDIGLTTSMAGLLKYSGGGTY